MQIICTLTQTDNDNNFYGPDALPAAKPTVSCMHSHTHNCFTAWILSGTTCVSRHQKGKINLDLLEQEIVSGSLTGGALQEPHCYARAFRPHCWPHLCSSFSLRIKTVLCCRAYRAATVSCHSAVDDTNSIEPSDLVSNEVRGHCDVRGQSSQVPLRHQTSSPSVSSLLSSGMTLNGVSVNIVRFVW